MNRPGGARPESGFTLLEVMIAVFVLGTVVGALLTMVQANLHRLGEARRELAAASLAKQRALEVLQAGASGQLPEVGTSDGRFPEPDDDLLWEETVEPLTLPLPADWGGGPAPSAIFEQPEGASLGRPSLFRVVIRAFPEGSDPESTEPFVVFVVERAEGLAGGDGT
jgi:prepilin-type N-terminal cleavage/methylation domain-containing protein